MAASPAAIAPAAAEALPPPGAAVGACALMVAVITEAIATTGFALPVVRNDVLRRTPTGNPLTQRRIFQFHAPLMATTFLTLLAQPITSTALAHMAHPERTLAAGPVMFIILLVMRGWGLALQEITVAQAGRPESRQTLKQFAWIVGGTTTALTGLIVFSPLLELYLRHVIHLRPYLFPYVQIGVTVGMAMPLITALGSWSRGVLVAAGRTNVIYRGMGINLAVHALLLAISVNLQLPGMVAASASFTLAAVVEYFYLARHAARASLPQPVTAIQSSDDALLAPAPD